MIMFILLSLICFNPSLAVHPPPNVWSRPFHPLSIQIFYHSSFHKASPELSRVLENMVANAVKYFRFALQVRTNEALVLTGNQLTRNECENIVGSYPHTDFILSVHYGMKMCTDQTLAFALRCATDKYTGRPTAGFLQVCRQKFEENFKTNQRKNEIGWEATIKHEILHALGFNRKLIEQYRMPDGVRGYEPMRSIPLKWRTGAGYVKHMVTMVVTPKVVHAIREHFDCATMQGAELENQGGQSSASSQWEKRLFEDEIMTAVRTHSYHVTQLTLALLEDSNWYKANYSMAGPWEWGKGLGCHFTQGSCLDWTMKPAKDPYPFCLINHDFRCSPDRRSKMVCKAYDKPKTGSEEFRKEYDYRAKELIGAPDGIGKQHFADFCPYYVQYEVSKYSNSDCYLVSNNDDEERKYALEIFSSTAKCFEIADGVITQQDKRGSRNEGDKVGCFENKCEDGRLWLKARNSRWYPCYHDGQLIHINKRMRPSGTTRFKIVCPSCEELCDHCAPEEEPNQDFGDPSFYMNKGARITTALFAILTINI